MGDNNSEKGWELAALLGEYRRLRVPYGDIPNVTRVKLLIDEAEGYVFGSTNYMNCVSQVRTILADLAGNPELPDLYRRCAK